MIKLIDLLNHMVKADASNLHICAGRRPYLRVYGRLFETEFDKMTPDEIKQLIYSILKKEHIQQFEKEKELDISYMIADLCRFRINIYLQRGSLSAIIKRIPFNVKSFEELGIPSVVREFVNEMKGLILVTGPHDSGKTTTLASVLEYINTTHQAHIISIEDPIEYIHRSKRSVINQREIGTDTHSYNDAMKYILRQDADVCLIGEIRDIDSVVTALRLAEAGIFVLSTIHSPSAAKTVDRIVNMFSPDQHTQIRVQLSITLKAVVSQLLVPSKETQGQILACEIMKVTHSIENLIRTYSIKQIPSVLQSGRNDNMWTMDQYLWDIYNKGKISKYELLRNAREPEEVQKWLSERE